MPMHRQEFAPISVTLDLDGHTVLISPDDVVAAATFFRIMSAAPATLAWHSMGVTRHDRTDVVTGFYVACGGEHYRRTEGSMSSYDYRDAIKVFLEPSANTDSHAIGTLYAYLSSGATVDPASTDQQLCLIPASTCKQCQQRLTQSNELQWRVCNNCAAICEHIYVMGPGSYRGNLVRMEYCKICGRANPDWEPGADPAQDMLEVVASGDVDALIVRQPGGQDVTIITRQQ
jgi:hypothetical protein